MSTAAASTSAPAAARESIVSRLILAPLAFISFILSLALVSHIETRERTREHNQQPSFSSKIKNALGLGSGAQPYDYVRSPYQDEGNSTSAGVRRRNGGQAGKDSSPEPWHWHTKQKKMLKYEIGEALEMRERMIPVLVVVTVVGTGLGYLGVRWAWHRFDGSS